MTVKFKVGFTMSAETLFSIMAKILPIEDLSVEEVPEKLQKVGKVEKIARLEGPEKRPQQLRRNRHLGPSLEGGVNGVILRALEDGQPHRYGDLRKVVAAAGYAASGMGAKLTRLRALNAVHQPDVGFWQIGEARKKVASG
jgi:hypothetical protein